MFVGETGLRTDQQTHRTQGPRLDSRASNRLWVRVQRLRWRHSLTKTCARAPGHISLTAQSLQPTAQLLGHDGRPSTNETHGTQTAYGMRAARQPKLHDSSFPCIRGISTCICSTTDLCLSALGNALNCRYISSTAETHSIYLSRSSMRNGSEIRYALWAASGPLQPVLHFATPAYSENRDVWALSVHPSMISMMALQSSW